MRTGKLRTAGKMITGGKDQRSQVENQHSVSTWSPTPNSMNGSPLPSPSFVGQPCISFPQHREVPVKPPQLGAFWQRGGVAFRGKMSSLSIHIYFRTTKPPFADFLFTEMVSVLPMDQVAILHYLHFSLMHFTVLCSTLPSFLSRSFYSQIVNQTYQSMLWIKVEYIVTLLGLQEGILNKVLFILFSLLTFVFFSLFQPSEMAKLARKIVGL